MAKYFPDQRLTAVLLCPSLIVLIPKTSICIYETASGTIDVWKNTARFDRKRAARVEEPQTMLLYYLWQHPKQEVRNVTEETRSLPISRLHDGIVIGEGVEIGPGWVWGVLRRAVVDHGEVWYRDLKVLEEVGFKVDERAMTAAARKMGHPGIW
ncbi:hypothetical protein BJX64DRAFT_285485 [Aspergillus heterothallicus]